MSCQLRKNSGSGYSKPSNSEKAKELTAAMSAMASARASQDAKLFPPLASQTVSVMQRTDPPDFSNSDVSTSTKR